jgi:hypothetical protein
MLLDRPGVHAARSILEDVSLKGYWFDWTQEVRHPQTEVRSMAV